MESNRKKILEIKSIISKISEAGDWSWQKKASVTIRKENNFEKLKRASITCRKISSNLLY